MPKLLAFLPCDRVIVSDENSSSLIFLYESLVIGEGLPADIPLPEDLVAPAQWWVYALWHRVDGDEGKEYEQRVRLTSPSGELSVEAIAPFRLIDRNHRVLEKINGFPVGQPGEYFLSLDLRDVGQDNEWTAIAVYPILVVHKPATP